MGKKGAGRSFFSNLPLDLRTTLRTQTLVPLVPGGDLSLESKAELMQWSMDNGDLLATQPPSPPSAGSVIDLVEEPEAVAESSVAGQKRARGPVQGSAKKSRKGKAVKNAFKDHPWDCTGLVKRYTAPNHCPPELVKYWYQRHFLLPQYDRLPLLLDDTGWFSITPQPIAKHIAERCRCDVIIDAFCGVGGNAIEFAKTCERVIAIDNDPVRIRLARHNALHLGVADRIEFVLGDFVDYAKTLKKGVDVVFLSPPWGGTEYLSFSEPNSSSYPLSAILPIHGKELFDLTSTITPNIAYYLPRNVDMNEISDLAPRLSQANRKRTREWVEVEEEWVGDKLKAVTAYYGGLVTE